METAYPKIDLIDLLGGLYRSCRQHLALGIALTVLLTGVMCLRTWRSYSPRYQASASFTVQVTNPLYAGQSYYNAAVAEQMAKTFPYILTSGVLSQEVKETLGISYMPSVSASAMGNTNIFTLTVQSGDPELAYDVLHCVIDIYPSVAEFVVGPTNLVLFDESGVPTKPVNTLNFRSAVLMGVAMGVGLWLALCIFYWLTHRTVTNEEELGQLVNLPRLGVLPTVRGFGKEKGKCPILDESNDKFGFNESVRLLRVRVEKELAKNGGKVLLVTSTVANEGKTTVSINLATALARRGKRTLLVDCDLRNPSVAAAFGISGGMGLTDYLRGKCGLEEALQRMDVENLYAVFAGKSAANPEELLGRKNMLDFVKAARMTFDYVILDTPPCALMADASEIGALADCALLAVRQDFACRSQILEGIQLLLDSGKPIIGCVLNMTKPLLGKGGSYSYSYYGYYGRYGRYGSEKQGEEKSE